MVRGCGWLASLVLPVPRLLGHRADPAEVFGVLAEPLVHCGTGTTRWGAGEGCLTATRRVDIQCNARAVVGGAWASGQVATVAPLGLVAMPHVQLAGDGPEPAVDLDVYLAQL